MTALAGIGTELELWQAAGLGESIRCRLGVNRRSKGWTCTQIVISLVLSNLAGGECVEHLRPLDKDKGPGPVLRLAETHGMPRRERRVLLGRCRKEHRRSAPSALGSVRYLDRFNDGEEESRRPAHIAFIPATTV